jgi:hypothetical protein
MEMLLDTTVCRVTSDADRLVAHFPRQRATGIVFGVFSTVGLTGLGAVSYYVWTGQYDSSPGLLLGAVLLLVWTAALGLRGVHWSRHSWGQVTLDSDGLRWVRGDETVGTWSAKQITRIHRRRWGVYDSHRLRLEPKAEVVLEAHTATGTHVRLAQGYSEELDAIEARVRQLLTPSAP